MDLCTTAADALVEFKITFDGGGDTQEAKAQQSAPTRREAPQSAARFLLAPMLRNRSV